MYKCWIIVVFIVSSLQRSWHWPLQPASEKVTIVAAAMSQSPLLLPNIAVAAAPSQLLPHHCSCCHTIEVAIAVTAPLVTIAVIAPSQLPLQSPHHCSCHHSHCTIAVTPLDVTPHHHTLDATPYCCTLAATPCSHILALMSLPHHCQQLPYHCSLHPHCHHSIIKSSLLSLPYHHCCHHQYCHFIVVIVNTVTSLLSSLHHHH